MTPIQTSRKENEDIIFFNLYGDIKQTNKKSKFKIGDIVRISKYKRKIFDKGFTPNWTKEIFTFTKVLNTIPKTYMLSDLQGEKLLVLFMSLNF